MWPERKTNPLLRKRLFPGESFRFEVGRQLLLSADTNRNIGSSWTANPTDLQTRATPLSLPDLWLHRPPCRRGYMPASVITWPVPSNHTHPLVLFLRKTLTNPQEIPRRRLFRKPVESYLLPLRIWKLSFSFSAGSITGWHFRCTVLLHRETWPFVADWIHQNWDSKFYFTT